MEVAQSSAAASPSVSSLDALAYGPVWNTRVVSAENPDGSKGGAARWLPDPSDPNLPHSKYAVNLGVGWKVRPFIRIAAGETATLADIRGPGAINQIFITSSSEQWRGLVLRMYWDGEDTPSVECPLGDFFAIGHDSKPHCVSSIPIVVGPHKGCNSYWTMPFRERATITLANETASDVEIVAYRVLYREHPVSIDARYFHAQWRRSVPATDNPEHTILDGVQGTGYYAGTYLAWTALSSGWWGEGEVKFFLDGDSDFPTIADNGTEDYFGGAWCFYDPAHPDQAQTFSSPYLGLPLADDSDADGPRRFSVYRWHVLDPIGFHKDIRVSVQTLGAGPDPERWNPRNDDIASLAVWYQQEPHAPFPALPNLHDRCDS